MALRMALLILISAMQCAVAESGRWVEVILTAYSPLDKFTRDDTNNPQRLTSTGKATALVPYGIAADPRSLPYGTRILIPPGLGYLDRSRPQARTFIVDDTGSAIRENTRRSGVIHLDLRYIGVPDALRFGRKRAWVFVYE